MRLKPSPSKMNRKVRQESKALVKLVNRALRRHRDRIPESAAREMRARATALENARREDDGALMRTELLALDTLAEEHLGFTQKSTLREYAESIGIAVLIALFLRAFVVEAFKIPSGSMIPTMEIGDHIFVNKFLYGIRIPYTKIKLFQYRKPHRGEVVVFIYPCNNSKDFIKRIVAVEGDSVEVRCDVLYVNGKPVPHELVGKSVDYWDVLEGTDHWRREAASSYEEHQGDHTYDTYHELARPSLDALRARRLAAGKQEGDEELALHTQDFPQMPRAATDTRRGTEDKQVALASRRRAEELGELEEWCETGETRATALGEFVAAPVRSADECAPRLHYVVPKGYVFAMGDNRANSKDSRSWGPVPLENIKGKALFIWWSAKPAIAGGRAWDRVGKIVN